MGGMAIFWATIIPILFVGTVLYVIYKIRSISQERRQRTEEREAALLANMQKPAPPRTGATAANETPAVPRPASGAVGQAGPSTAALTRRARIVTDAQRVLFLVLRAALPEHFIMAHVRIVDLLELPHATEATERDVRLRALARERLDFVVCDNDLVPIAAVVLYEAGIQQVPDESAKIEALRAIGVRFLRFRADSLPRPVEARSLLLA
jgi:hypothetical protein